MSQRVLLLHEDDGVRDLAVRALGRMGVEVDIVPRGADAVAALDTRPYTVAVVDHALCDHLLEVIAERVEKPIVICTTPDRDPKGFNTAVVNLLIPQPYDAPTLVGVIIACVTEKTADA